MNQTTARRKWQEVQVPRAAERRATYIYMLPPSEPLKTRPIDVISPLGRVYVKENGGVRPLGYDEQPSNKTYLLKTNGLTEIQKIELREQNVKIHYIKGLDTPYIEVSALTARALMDLASGMAGCQ